jgi:hypothetical protein
MGKYDPLVVRCSQPVCELGVGGLGLLYKAGGDDTVVPESFCLDVPEVEFGFFFEEGGGLGEEWSGEDWVLGLRFGLSWGLGGWLRPFFVYNDRFRSWYGTGFGLRSLLGYFSSRSHPGCHRWAKRKGTHSKHHPKENRKEDDSLPYKLLQSLILHTLRAPPIFPLKHRTIHTRLKKRPRWPVCPSSDELEEFVNVAVEVAPCKRGLGVGRGARTKVEFFRDEEDFFFVSCRWMSWSVG